MAIIDAFDKDGNFTVEFKQYVKKLIDSETEKITTDGKCDREKMIAYINDCIKKESDNGRNDKV